MSRVSSRRSIRSGLEFGDLRNVFKAVVAACLMVTIAGCVSPPDLPFKHLGFGACVRLDREPFPGEDDPECSRDASPKERTGTLHRDPQRRLDADVLPISISGSVAAKLPVADCVWGSSASAGNGDAFGLQWDAAIAVGKDNVNADDPPRLSSCRFDFLEERVSLQDPGTQVFMNKDGSTGCYIGAGRADNPAGSVLTINGRFGENKLVCDNDTDLLRFRLLTSLSDEDGYGSCGNYEAVLLQTPEYPDTAGDCGTVRFSTPDGVLPAGNPFFTRRVAPRTDGEYVIEGSVSRVLSPAIHTVNNSRSIARPLTLTAAGGEWQTPVLIDGPAGQQRWHENFLDSVRVDTVRVFAVSEPGSSDREYLNLDEAELLLTDPVVQQANITCAANASQFDMPACNIIATPTYRNESVAQVGFALPDPLLWSVRSDEIANDGRFYFIEFDLVSTFVTRQASLMAEVPNIDFGGLLPTDYTSTLVRFTNTGFGPATITDVQIDPGYGQPYAFEAKRLDDPEVRPMPIFAEPTGLPFEYRFGFEPWPVGELLYSVDEHETHAVLRRNRMHGQLLSLYGAEVRFEADTPVRAHSSGVFNDPSDPQRVYPFEVKIYTEWQTPFVLRPGASRTVQVRAMPAHVGDHKGRLIVSGFATDDPSIALSSAVELKISGRAGPRLDVLPRVVTLPNPAGGNPLPIIFASHGDSPVEHDTPEIVDSISSLHVGESQYFHIDESIDAGEIQPGDSAVSRVRYEPGCFATQPAGDHHKAMVRMDTTNGEVNIALRGDPDRWASTTGQCGPK